MIVRPERKFTNFGFVKEIFLLVSFGIVLPTVDVYSDGALITQLYTGTPTEFKCLSDDKIIRAKWAQDGVWDCYYGSDERGT